MSSISRLFLSSVFVLSLTVTTSRAACQVVQNPLNAVPESVWTVTTGSAADIRFSYLDGTEWAPAITLGSDGLVDSTPQLAFDGNGGRGAAWLSADDQVVLSVYAPPSTSWSEGIEMSDGSETASTPSLVMFEDETFVGYESLSGSNHKVTVSKMDTGGNVGRTVMATSESTSPLDVRLHVEDDHLWVDWIDSESELGYAVWSKGWWTAAAAEAYDGPTDVNAARRRISVQVLADE